MHVVAARDLARAKGNTKRHAARNREGVKGISMYRFAQLLLRCKYRRGGMSISAALLDDPEVDMAYNSVRFSSSVLRRPEKTTSLMII